MIAGRRSKTVAFVVTLALTTFGALATASAQQQAFPTAETRQSVAKTKTSRLAADVEALRWARTLFGVDPMGQRLGATEPWTPGEEPRFQEADIAASNNANVKLAAVPPVPFPAGEPGSIFDALVERADLPPLPSDPGVVIKNGIGGGQTVAPKGEVTGQDQRPMTPPGARPGVFGVLPAARVAAAAPAPASVTPPAKPQHRGGWMIQVGAYPAEHAAKQRLTAVQSKASKMLTGAEAFADSIEKGGMTYYRARFAGLDKEKAEAACNYLKRNDVECVIVKDTSVAQADSQPLRLPGLLARLFGGGSDEEEDAATAALSGESRRQLVDASGCLAPCRQSSRCGTQGN